MIITQSADQRVCESANNQATNRTNQCCLRLRELEQLKKRLAPLVKKNEGDSVRFYTLCVDDILRIEILGLGAITKDRAFYMQ